MATLILTAAATALTASAGFGTALAAAGITSTLATSVITTAISTAASLAGGLLDQALFGPKQAAQEGPRLAQVQAAIGNAGVAIPRLSATSRLPGHVIWSTRFREEATEEEVGGKGGALGGGGSVTNYQYFVSFAVMFCEGPADVGTIYADAKPLDLEGVNYTVYRGAQGVPQSIPVMQAIEKTGDVPGYQGVCLVVFEDLPLEKFGNRVPQISAQVTRVVGQNTLPDLLREICENAGVRADISEVPRTAVDGYVVAESNTPRARLQGLLNIFEIDMIEGPGLVVKFRPRTGSPKATFKSDDLVAQDNRGPMTFRRLDPATAATAVRLTYLDRTRNYQPDVAEAQRQTRIGGGVAETQTAVVLDEGKATTIAASLLAGQWSALTSLSATLPPSAIDAGIGAGDVIRVEEADGTRHDVRLTRAAFEWSFAVEGRVISPAETTPRISDAQTFILADNTPPTTVTLIFADLPLLRRDDGFGPHVAVRSTVFRGANVFAAFDSSGYRRVAAPGAQAVTGILGGALPEGSARYWDRENTIDVTLDRGALSSKTKTQVLNGENAAAIKSATSEWEIVAFTTATLIAENQYRLSGLLRGLRGTERHMTHPAGAAFVLLDAAAAKVTLPDEYRAIDIDWRYGPATRAQDDPLYTQTTRSFSGVSWRPYSPAGLRGWWDAQSGALRLSWRRRARAPLPWTARSLPAEDAERYRVKIPGLSIDAMTSNPAIVIPLDSAPPPIVDVSVEQWGDVWGWGDPLVCPVDTAGNVRAITGRATAASGVYIHNQAAPASIWTIPHGLGYHPAVSVTDAAGDEVYGDVTHDTLNQTTLTFSAAITGEARLS